MGKNSFLLVDLQDDASKELARTIQNTTCRSILDYLANKQEASESEIAKSLTLPLSTVHYNLQALLKAKLVTANEYHYSTKGREVYHYKLVNQYIIIAPQKIKGLKTRLRQSLKGIFPIALVASGGAVVVHWLTRAQSTFSNEFITQKSAPVAQVGFDALPQAVPIVADVPLRSLIHTMDPVLWFSMGAIVAIVTVLIYQIWKS